VEPGKVTIYRQHDAWLAEWINGQGVHLLDSWSLLQQAKDYFQKFVSVTRWVRDHDGKFWMGFYVPENAVVTKSAYMGMPRGVTKENNRYRARTRHNGRKIELGRFDTVEEAAAAYEAFTANRVLNAS
jgi:hypothetical protein